MKPFYHVLLNTLIANVTTSFLWFCLTFWVFLETQSVLATGIVGGGYMLFTSLAAIPFGSFVDKHRKKYAMQIATYTALTFFVLAAIVYQLVPSESLLNLTQPWLWLFISLVLIGSVAESMRNIAMSTTVTILVPKEDRDRANGMVGTVSGVSFLVTSVFSGLAIGFLGMGWALVLAIILMSVAGLHLLVIRINEDHLKHDKNIAAIDVKTSIATIKKIPGLPALIFFTTFNNLLGGVFMALMDAYGLSLMSVQAWGLLWGALSSGFIVGGIVVSAKGLGNRPLRTLLLVNVIMWSITIAFPIYSIVLTMAIGMFVYMCLVPVVEAVEQTIIQRVVPLQKQGRVFGFAQAIESASMPLMAFIIAPVAQFAIIPAMREGGVLAQTIGSWFGTGQVRAIALVFILAAIIGLIVTLLAFKTKSYRLLSVQYQKT